MAILSPSTLETADIGTSGWNAIYSANWQKVNTKLGILMSSTDTPGSAAVADPAVQTSETLTDSTGGSATNTIGAISGSGADADLNNNFASLTDEVNKLKADVGALRTTLAALLVELRATGGCGVLADS